MDIGLLCSVYNRTYIPDTVIMLVGLHIFIFCNYLKGIRLTYAFNYRTSTYTKILSKEFILLGIVMTTVLLELLIIYAIIGVDK